MKTEKTRHNAKAKEAQSAIEYLTTYGWAILIIGIIVSILYLYLAVPPQIVTNTCNFVNGASCQDFVIGTNSTTHVTKAEFWLTNTQPNPIENPILYMQYAGQNVTPVTCLPTNTPILAGGLVNCTVILPTNATLGSLVSGNIYLNATYCGLSNQSYQSINSCQQGAQQTYTGSFTAHVQPQEPLRVNLVLTAANMTQLANGQPDLLTANVTLSSFPLKGATVNFTVNNSDYYLNPILTNTNTNGNALSDASSTTPGNVNITATYAGVSNSIVIEFAAPIYVVYLSTNFPYCSSAGVIAQVDSASYTCNQLSGRTFTYAKGSTHSYSFLSPVSAGSGIQGTFTNVTVEGITYTDPQGAIVADTNLTVPFSYSTQYYFTEFASPASGGTVSPGNGWYNSLASISIGENALGLFAFNDWTGSGTGEYSGSNPVETITISNTPISETAYFTSTSTSTTSSTSTSSTSSTSSILASSTSTVVSTTSTIATLNYPLIVNVEPNAASSDWTACAYYTPPGGSAQHECTDANTTSVDVPSGTYVSSVTVTQTNPSSPYAFSDWSGSYSSDQQDANPDATINSQYTLNAQFGTTISTTSTIIYYELSEGCVGCRGTQENNCYVTPGAGQYAAGSQIGISVILDCCQNGGSVNWYGSGTGSYSGSEQGFEVTMGSDISEVATVDCS